MPAFMAKANCLSCAASDWATRRNEVNGLPVDQSDAQGAHVKMVDHLAVPPGSRAEFIVQTPAPGAHAMLFTRMVDTGPDGENDPNRNIAVVDAFADAPEPPPLPAAG